MNNLSHLGNYAIKNKSPLRGVKQSPEFIKKRTATLKNRKRTLESRKRMSESRMGKTPWNKGIKTGIITRGMTGKKHSLKTLEKYSQDRLGIKFTEDHKLKLGKRKQNHWKWKGGITKESTLIRHSPPYKTWRFEVFKRDNFTCIWCNSKENLNADHIKPFAFFPELRFELSNGRTLCIDCHKKTDTYGGRTYARYIL